MSTDDIIEENVVTPPTWLPEEHVRDQNNSDDKEKENQEPKKRSAMSKAGIIEEVVTPLMKHLEIAEKHVLSLAKAGEQVTDQNSRDDKVKKKFEEIMKMVENKKAILEDRKEWEVDVIDEFSIVEQHIDNILEDKECDSNTELDSIVKKLNEMMKNVTPSQRPQDDNTESSDSKKDERSFKTSWDDCSKPFIDEIIDTIDPQLRQCLYCLSIFPEDSIIKRRLLIYWWIGLKLVRPEGDNTAEQIGGILFDDLVDKGILIPTTNGTRKHNDVVDRCTVDTIFHEKLISSAKEKRFIIERKEISGGSLEVCTIQKNRLENETILNVNEMYLESGLIKSENPKSGSVKIDSDVSSKKSEGDISSRKREGDFSPRKSEGEVPSKKSEGDDSSKKSAIDVKKMAVMQVGQWRCVGSHHIEANKTDFLNELIPSLTYLSLQNISRISELPEAIAKSTSLMILDVRACHNLENLPPKSTALKSLTHLDVSMCYLLDHIPKWISTLNNLEVLKGFVIGSSGNKNRCGLSDISGLHKLRKLSINIGDSNFSDKDFNILKKIPKLRSLTLTWGRDLDKSESVQEKHETEVNVAAPQTQVQQPEQRDEKQKNPNVEQEKEINVVRQAAPPEQDEITSTNEEEEEEGTINETVPQTPQPELKAKPPINEPKKILKSVLSHIPRRQTHAPSNTSHEELEKLDLRCFPRAEAPTWLNPTNLNNLKRLYIRGGKIGELGCSNVANAGDVWAVETLRLRFLKNLKITKPDNLKILFPSMKFLEWAEHDKSGEVKVTTFKEVNGCMAQEA